MDSPQSWNRFSYTFNNPIVYADPSGHNPLLLVALVVVAIIGITAGAQTIEVGHLESGVAISDPVAFKQEQDAAKAWDYYHSCARCHYAIDVPITDNAKYGPRPLTPLGDLHNQGVTKIANGALSLVGGLTGLGSFKTPASVGLPDDALVCRGGQCLADQFEKGTGVTKNPDGTLSGISVNSYPGVPLDELATGIPNGQIGVTTVGDVRLVGGEVIPDPLPNNPYHALLNNVTSQQAQKLLTPTIKNPYRLKMR